MPPSSSRPPSPINPASSRWSWAAASIVAVLALLALLVGGIVALAANSLSWPDNKITKKHFEDEAKAREFTSIHLPFPLPHDVVVDSLEYERWTDWHLRAELQFSASAQVDEYLVQAHKHRSLRDDYCGSQDPAGGARYYLPASNACGTLRRSSPMMLSVWCYTR